MIKSLLHATFLTATLATSAIAQGGWPACPPYVPVTNTPAWVATATGYWPGNATWLPRAIDNAIRTEQDARYGLESGGTHTSDPNFMWLVQMSSTPDSWYRVDFQEENRLNALKLWNYNEGGVNNRRGVKEVGVWTAPAGVNPAPNTTGAAFPSNPASLGWTLLTNHVFEIASGSDGYEGCGLVVFPSTVRAQHVLFVIKSTHHQTPPYNYVFSTDAYVGISKILFLQYESKFVLSTENVTSTFATLKTIFDDDDPSPTLTAYWALEDAGTDATAWTNALGFGASDQVSFAGGNYSAFATELQGGSNYVFRFMAETSGGETLWSGPGTFTTLNEVPVVVMRSVETGPLGVIARVGLTWAGSPGGTADILFFHGTNDCGAVAENWTAGNPGFAPVLTNGCPAGEYAFAMPGLAFNTTYHCRAFAFNNKGTNAAPQTLSFTTPNHSTWTAGAAPDTRWDVTANWDHGVPAPGVTANFYCPGATVTATNDLAVGAALANGGGQVFFDLGGNTLFAPGGFNVGSGAVPGYPLKGNNTVILTNGVLDVGAANISVGRDTASQQNSLSLLTGTHVRAYSLHLGIAGGNRHTLVMDRARFDLAGEFVVNNGQFQTLSIRDSEIHLPFDFKMDGSTWDSVFAMRGDPSDAEASQLVCGSMILAGVRNSILFQNTRVRLSETNGRISFYGNSNTLVFDGSELGMGNTLQCDSDDTAAACRVVFSNSLLNANEIVTFGRMSEDVHCVLHNSRAILSNQVHIASNPALAGAVPNSLVFSGPETRMEVPIVRLNTNAVMRFEIPDDGFNAVPLAVGPASRSFHNMEGRMIFDRHGRIVIHARGFTGEQTLVEVSQTANGNNSGPGIYLRDLPGNITNFQDDTGLTLFEPRKFRLPDPAHPHFVVDIPDRRIATLIQTPHSVTVRISRAPTLFMVR